MKKYRRVSAEIDLNAVEFNFDQMSSHIPAQTKIMAVDSSKFEKTAFCKIVDLKDIDYVVSNASLPNSITTEKCLTL